MATSFDSSGSLPLIPLPSGQVLLPGVVKRIFVSDRPDILALLRKYYGMSPNDFLSHNQNLVVGCVPLNPPAPLQLLPDNKGQHNVENIEGKPPISSIKEQRGINGNGGRDDVVRAVIPAEPGKAKPGDIFSYGVTSRIVGLEDRSVGGTTIVVEGELRFKIKEFVQETPFIEARVTTIQDDPSVLDHTGQRLFMQLKTLSRELLLLLRLSSLSTRQTLPPLIVRKIEQFIARKDQSEASQLANFMVSAVESSLEDQLVMLSASTVNARLEKAVEIISKQVSTIKDQLRSSQKSMVMRTIGAINPNMPNRVGRPRSAMSNFPPEEEQGEDEVAELSRKLEEAKLSPEAAQVAQRELRRLRKMSPAQAEYQVCRTYIENILEVPWVTITDDQLDDTMLARARKQLDDDHYGLDKIKRRLLEYLAVLRLKHQLNLETLAKEAAATAAAGPHPVASPRDAENQLAKQEAAPRRKRFVDKSPILLLVGPPGTGKTSLAKSVATALGRKFHRISLGGVRDEAEIRGHRRTYVAALPGVIVSSLKKVGVANPVILLDEIDKLGGSNFHGDPSAAMLEVLDPEQNWSFNDHYMSIPLDLSKVLFIATANSLDTIPAPLLDRMETIHLSGYTSLEKKHIASQYLIPKQLHSNALSDGQVVMPDEVIMKIISSYTREAGVRNLEREIGSVCRAKAVEYAEAKDAKKLETYKREVEVEDLERFLGIEKYEEEIAELSSRPGVVTGLVAFSTGGNGSILFIEMTDMPGSGKLQLTGHLGSVIKESVEVALSWVKSHAFDLGITEDPTENLLRRKDIHVHCPAGAVPKDGPSAGVAMTVCLISLLSGRPVSPTLAMTGEISLRGKVTAVGGIREKTIGALRAGVKTVLLPAQNRKDGQELPLEVKNNMNIVYVRNIWEVLKQVWPDWSIGDEHIETLESRL